MEILDNKLGRALNAKDLAAYLGLDPKTVRKYYRELGGIRLGSRIVFFERLVIYAVQERIKVDCPDPERRKATGESVSNESGSNGLGGRNAAKTRKRLEREDRHGLFG